MIDWLDQLDRGLFFWINGAHFSSLDSFMIYFSDKFFWAPYYGLIIFLFYQINGAKKTIVACLMVGLVILIADQGASGLFKPLVGRLRPCHSDFSDQIHLVVAHCGGQFGFFSSHSANFFGLALFSSGIISPTYRWFGWVSFFIATLVGYSRVYLGVHYPGDVIAGCIWGLGSGYVGLFLWRKFEGRIPSPKGGKTE